MPRALSALVLATALTACGSTAPETGAADTAPSAASTPSQTVSRGQTSGTGSPTAPQDGTAQVITLAVTGGEVSGATARVPVKLGSQVQLQVTADVTDEVHVHGYDLTKDTVPGQPVTVLFTADIPGVFEVELEDSKLPLTRLQVQ
jgi:hypothetical protein